MHVVLDLMLDVKTHRGPVQIKEIMQREYYTTIVDEHMCWGALSNVINIIVYIHSMSLILSIERGSCFL
jgi:hypothetical protein